MKSIVVSMLGVVELLSEVELFETGSELVEAGISIVEFWFAGE